MAMTDRMVVVKELDHVLREIDSLVLAYVGGSARVCKREVCRMKAMHHGLNPS